MQQHQTTRAILPIFVGIANLVGILRASMAVGHRLKTRRQLRSARRGRWMPRLIRRREVDDDKIGKTAAFGPPSEFWREVLLDLWARPVVDLTPGAGLPAQPVVERKLTCHMML